ncbi:MAG TPA: hypothetical protein VFE51_20340 [Verrucomicrobiae bacterium]|nr:hypothetical protein [Verrucomicrobiae bacterium]
MSQELKSQWLPKAQARYARRHREGKSRMLDELCEDYHYERKYAIKLLSGTLAPPSGRARPWPEWRYELVEPVVRKVWLTAEQPCGKRLVPILRQWLPYYEQRFGAVSSKASRDRGAPTRVRSIDHSRHSRFRSAGPQFGSIANAGDSRPSLASGQRGLFQ